jgi:hypothetical protein
VPCRPSIAAGRQLDELIEQGDHAALLAVILEPSGLDLKRLPKGLIPFHRYPSGARTAFEEHLIEAARYGCLPGGTCRCHFTVSSEHQSLFESRWEQVKPVLESRLGVTFDVGFSVQSPATDSLAVDADNLPLRTADGDLLFRPAGHGALLENLQRLDADVVFVKNIDNVAPAPQHEESGLWKRLLAGLLGRVQQRIFTALENLESDAAGTRPVHEALRLIERDLVLRIPSRVRDAGLEDQRAYARRRLNRPLRVCGMVPNEGHPGGGPFWVGGTPGELTGQIVEAAQVDRSSREQQRIWKAATHFNPVDLVCGLRDRHGQAYDLRRFVDPAAAILTEKSHHGRTLRALERPGLWNGAMAGWNTVFVEVPQETFTPAKTVFDLALPSHQV